MITSNYDYKLNHVISLQTKQIPLTNRMHLKSEDEDLWSDILNDVSTASTNKDKKCLLILGDEFVGKTAIINRLRRLEGHATKAGLGLEYSYLDIRVSLDFPQIFF